MSERLAVSVLMEEIHWYQVILGEWSQAQEGRSTAVEIEGGLWDLGVVEAPRLRVGLVHRASVQSQGELMSVPGGDRQRLGHRTSVHTLVIQ